MKRHLLLFALLLLISGAMFGQLWQDTVASPTFSPEGGTYNEAQRVIISCVTEGATIRYTTNGTEPTESSPTYNNNTPLEINETTTVKAKAWKLSFQPSATDSATYIIKSPDPATLEVEPESLSGFICISGSGPSPNQSITVSGSNLTENVTIMAYQYFEVCETATGSFSQLINLHTNATGDLNDTVYVRMKEGLPEGSHSDSLTIASSGVNRKVSLDGTVSPQPIVATPIFDPEGDTYNEAQRVIISCETEGATIHYTIDGTEPTESSTTYNNNTPLNIIQNTTVKAKAWKDGYQPSPTHSATYTITYTIKVVADPSNAGEVSVDSAFYYYGDLARLTASPYSGYQFESWKKNDSVVSTNANYSFTVTENATYTAYFTEVPVIYYTINTEVTPPGAGTVTGGGTFAEGSSITLTATANEGYTFSHWQDGDTNSTRTITVTSDAVYTAFFTLNQYTVEVMSNPEEGGMVYGNGVYTHGVTCTLTAIPNDGYSFSNWMDGDNVVVSSELIYSFIVTENALFTANFIRQHNINVEVTPDGAGTVMGLGTYDYGTECTLTATPSDAYYFVNWTEDGLEVSTDTTYSFIVTADRDLVAHFKEIPCIEDINEIVAKKHTDYTGTYALVLIYPNPAEAYNYQWLYSTEENGAYLNLDEGTDQYYYKGGALDNGWYKVRLTKKDDTSCKGETNPIMVNNSPRTIHIYPNPTRQGNNIVIENSTEGTAQLIVSSIDGRVLHTQTLTDKQTTINLNLALGIYVVRIIDCEGYTSVNKLIIQ